MALPPGFLKWDGAKYIFVPDFDQSFGPTIINEDTGTIHNIPSTKDGLLGATIIFTGIANMTVTGIVSGIESRELKIFNTDPVSTLTLSHLNAGSEDVNQIVCPGDTDFTLASNEAVLLAYSISENKWRVVQKLVEAGGSVPGGLNTQLQYNNNGALGGIQNWTRFSENRIHIGYHIMSDGPALEFNSSNTITRLYGSWLFDGFRVGDYFSMRAIWYDNNNVLQTPLNIQNAIVTAVNDNDITITASISPLGYSMGGDSSASGGGFLSGGGIDPTLIPNTGIIRIPTPPSFLGDIEVITGRDTGGQTIPLISFSPYGELMIGGTWNEANSAAGVTNRRPSDIAMWGYNLIDFTDERIWRDDKDGFFDYIREFRAHVSTSDATPTLLVNKSVSSAIPMAFIELHVSARKIFPANEGATWRFFGAKTSSTFDWRTANYHSNTTGAASWNCVVTGDATINVTGQNGVGILWKVYGRFITG